jgi:transposase-like protein
MSILSQPQFHDEDAAFEYVETALWPNGPICPHCGGVERISVLTNVRGSRSKKNPKGAIRHGLKFCGQCRQQFTVRIGTIFEETKLPLRIWLQAMHLMASSKKGVSAHQLHRTLEVTYKTAWFLAHRIREAMRSGDLAPFGGAGGIVEVDETFIGQDPEHPVQEPRSHFRFANMNKVLSLIDRDTGAARSFVVKDLRIATIAPILDANIAREAWLMSDEAARYKHLGWNFAAHGTVNHGAEEYVSKVDPRVHTNTVEGFYSIFKRGMRGIYQHCSAKHLHRYVAEFDFRYSNRLALGVDDQDRAGRALAGVVGKRLTYRKAGVGTQSARARP